MRPLRAKEAVSVYLVVALSVGIVFAFINFGMYQLRKRKIYIKTIYEWLKERTVHFFIHYLIILKYELAFSMLNSVDGCV